MTVGQRRDGEVFELELHDLLQAALCEWPTCYLTAHSYSNSCCHCLFFFFFFLGGAVNGEFHGVICLKVFCSVLMLICLCLFFVACWSSRHGEGGGFKVFKG